MVIAARPGSLIGSLTVQPSGWAMVNRALGWRYCWLKEMLSGAGGGGNVAVGAAVGGICGTVVVIPRVKIGMIAPATRTKIIKTPRKILALFALFCIEELRFQGEQTRRSYLKIGQMLMPVSVGRNAQKYRT